MAEQRDLAIVCRDVFNSTRAVLRPVNSLLSNRVGNPPFVTKDFLSNTPPVVALSLQPERKRSGQRPADRNRRKKESITRQAAQWPCCM